MSFIDPFTYREIGDDTFNDRVIDYQIERESLADQLDDAVNYWMDTDDGRDVVDDLRAQLAVYDDALEFMSVQADADTYDDLTTEAPDDDGDSDDDFAGYDSDILERFADDVPEWWLDAFEDYDAVEYEFGVDYEEGET